MISACAMLGATPSFALLQSPGSPPTGPTWLNTATVTFPGPYDFNTGANWLGGVAPTSGDTAVFGATMTPNISVSTATSLDAWFFSVGAAAYTFTVNGGPNLTFNNAGIDIQGGSVSIAASGGSIVQFLNLSSAGSASFTTATTGQVRFSNNSNAGSASIVNNGGGVTQFFGISDAASASITNNNGGVTAFNTASTAGNATITNNSGGAVYFFGNSTGGNARFINNLGGIVDFSGTTTAFGPSADANLTAGSIEGAGNFYLGTNALTVGGNDRSTTVSGVISDCGPQIANVCTNTGATGGSLVKTGIGTLTLTGANTYTGNTVVNNGALTVSGGGSISNAPGDTIVGDTMGSTATMSVSGKSLSGTPSQLTTRNLYVGNGMGSNGTFNVLNGATVSASGLIFANGGTGTVNIDGIGSSLTGTGGIGIFNYLGFAGTVTVNVTNDGSLVSTSDISMGSNPGTIANLNVSSGGSVTTRHFYIGDSSGSQATVTVSGVGSSLTSNDTTFVGNTGVGALNLLNGATANLAGLTVGGTGTLMVSAGSVVTQTSATSALQFGPGATLSFGVTPETAGRANAAGVFNIDPASKLVITGTTGAARTYALVTSATGVTGMFDTMNISYVGGFRNPVLTYSLGSIAGLFLTVDANSIASLLAPGVVGTPVQVAAGIDAALLAGVTLPPGFNGVFNLTGDALVAALKQISGQSKSGTTQTATDASNSFMGAMFDPNVQGRAPAGGGAPGYASEDNDDAMAYAARRKFTHRERDARNAVRPRSNLYDPRWSVWGTAYGGTSTTTGSAVAGTNDVTSRAYGFIAGADYNLNARTTVGFALGGGASNFGVAGGLGGGRAEMFQAGLFAKHVMGAAYVSGGLSYTFQDVTTNRTVTIAGTDQLQAKFNANTFAGRIEGGYRVATPVVGVTPYAALQVTNISLPSYGEVAISGNNTFALNYAAQDTTVVRTELGARFDRSYAMQTAMLTLRGRAAWAHDEGNNRNVSAVFGSLPGSNFTVNGAIPSKDLALLSAGADVAWLNNVTLSGTFEGQFSSTTTGVGGKGTVRYVW